MKRLFIALYIQLFIANLAYANNLNGNLNSNTANSSLNAGYISDTTVTNSTQFPVSSAIAPLGIPTSDCLGTVSAGGQGQFAGFSLGFSKQSKPCNIRAYAIQFVRYSPMWWGIMCQDKIVKKADKDTKGGNCPDEKEEDWIKYEYPRGR